jgi:hypothetical protein
MKKTLRGFLAQLALLAAVIAAPRAFAARRVIFVDNSRTADGVGTFEQPFRRLADAQRAGSYDGGEVIYVAETSTPYEESIALQKGQMLIGSAFGLDAVRVDLKTEVDGPAIAAVRGPGPVIRGTISIAGDNVVAGLTVVSDFNAGVVALQPRGGLTIRDTWFRSSNAAFVITLQEVLAPVSIAGGGWSGVNGGSGISIAGGASTVTFEHFTMGGDVANAIFIGNRTSGAIRFTGGSSIRIDRALRDAITIANVKAAVSFDDSIQVTAEGSRALFVTGTDKVTVSGAASRFAASKASAIDIRDSNVDMTIESVSAEGAAEGIVLNKLRGRFAITGTSPGGKGSGGTIRGARGSGIRVEQSSGVSIAHVDIVDTAGSGRLPCPDDLQSQQNVVCRAGLFLRHLTKSTFDDIVIDGTGESGVNGNNLGDVEFRGLHVLHAGSSIPRAVVVLQETSGSVAFHLCKIEGSGAGGVTIEQRINHGSIAFDRCSFSALEGSKLPLIQSRIAGFGHLDVSVNDARVARVTGPFLDMSVADTARATIAMRDAFVDAYGASAGIVSVGLRDAADTCVDVSGYYFDNEQAVGPVVLRVQSPQARLRVVSGSKAVIDAPAGSVSDVSSCAPPKP